MLPEAGRKAQPSSARLVSLSLHPIWHSRRRCDATRVRPPVRQSRV